MKPSPPTPPAAAPAATQPSPPPQNRWRLLLARWGGFLGRFMLGRGPFGTLGVALSGLAIAWVAFGLLNMSWNSLFGHLQNFAPVSFAESEQVRAESRDHRRDGTVPGKSAETAKESQVLIVAGAGDSDAYALSKAQVFRMRRTLARAAEGGDSPFKRGENDPAMVSKKIRDLFTKNTPENPHRQERTLALAIAFSWCWEYLGVLPVHSLVSPAPSPDALAGLPATLADLDPNRLPETFRNHAAEMLTTLMSLGAVWRATTLPEVQDLDEAEKNLNRLLDALSNPGFLKAEQLAGNPLTLSQDARREKKSALAADLYRRPMLLPPKDYRSSRFAVVFFALASGEGALRLAVEIQPVEGNETWIASYAAYGEGISYRTEPKVILERSGSWLTGFRPTGVGLTERQLAGNFLREAGALAKRIDGGYTSPEDHADVERFVEAALVARLGRFEPREDAFKDWPKFQPIEVWTAWPRRINGGNAWGIIQFATTAIFFAGVVLCLDRWWRGRAQIKARAVMGTRTACEESRADYETRYGNQADAFWRRERPYEVHACDPAGTREANLEAALDQGGERVRYALATIPNLGFLGTVIGISTALLSMSRTTGAALERQLAIQEMSISLGIAFDTTFVALSLSIVLLLLHLLVSQREADWKAQVGAREGAKSS